MTFKSSVVGLALSLAGLIFISCGSVPTPNTPTTVSESPTRAELAETPHGELNATPEAADADPNTKTVVIENSLVHRGKTRGVRSSTSSSGPTGEFATTTIYLIDDTYVNFPWVTQSTTPDSTELPCNQLGSASTWRGNPAPIGTNVAINQIGLRIDESRSEPDTISLTIENNGTESVEMYGSSFRYTDKLQSQSRRGPRNHGRLFAESIELGANDSKTVTIDRNDLGDDPVKAQDVVLMFRDLPGRDTAYLAITQPSDDTFTSTSFKLHHDAQEVATTWSTRPAPLGKAVKVDASTTVYALHTWSGAPQSTSSTRTTT